MRVSPSRQGLVLFIILFCVIVVSVLAIAFFTSSRQGGAVAFRFEKSETIRQIARAAMDEAFGVVWRETADPESSFAKWLIAQTQIAIGNPDGTAERPVNLPLSLEKATEIVSRRWSGFKAVVQASARVFDARGTERKQERTYYGKEGVGSLQLTVIAMIENPGGKPFAETTLIRHHDFRIVSILSQSTHRTRYAPTGILDYLLLVREGAWEFEQTNGESLNHPEVKIAFRQPASVDAFHRGKIFFGGTDDPSSGRMVFLNLPETWQNIPGILPQGPPNPVATIGYNEVTALLPGFPELISEEIDKSTSLPTERDHAWQLVRSDLKGVFEASVKAFPESRAGSGTEGIDEAATVKVLTDQGEGPLFPRPVACPASVELIAPDKLGDAPYLDSILEGTITRRCLYYSTFRLIFPDTIPIPRNYGQRRFLCLHPPLDFPGISPEQHSFSQALQTHDPMKKEFRSQFSSFFPLGANGDERATNFPTRPSAPFKAPVFFDRARTGTTRINVVSKEFFPLGYPTLRSWVFESPSQLERAGIIEYPNGKGNPGRLNLRGIIALMPGDPGVILDLGKDGPLEIHGQGCLISLHGFHLSNRLTKAVDGKKNFCILRSLEGPIRIATSEPIEAFLIALSKSSGKGLLSFSDQNITLNLKGGLAVNVLSTGTWPKNRNHLVEYDPDLRSPTESTYQIALSRWITFTRSLDTGS